MVFPDYFPDKPVCHAETLADYFPLKVFLFFNFFTAPVRKGGIKGLASHDGTVHFLFREPPQIFNDITVRYRLNFLNGFPYYHFRKCGGGGNGAPASEGPELRVFDYVIFNFQVQGERVAADDAAHFADSVCIFNDAYVFRFCIEFLYFICIVPHRVLPVSCCSGCSCKHECPGVKNIFNMRAVFNVPYAWEISRASLRASIISSICSIPIESRMRSGVSPPASCSSPVSCECDVLAG